MLETIIILLKKDVTQAAGLPQICASQVAVTESAIHVMYMYDIFKDHNIEVILLIDAENAFNLINKKVMLRNLKFICLIITAYISNSYTCPVRLFIIGSSELLSNDGTTQGDSTSMGVYSLDILPLLQYRPDFISINELNPKELAFTYDFTVTGKL